MISRIRRCAVVLTAALLCACAPALAGPAKTKAPAEAKPPAEARPLADKDMEPLKLALPHPNYSDGGSIPRGRKVEPALYNPRPPFMVPKGTLNLSRGRQVALSDPAPFVGEASLVTDGDKEFHGEAFVEMGPGPQWAQVDLGDRAILRAIVVWHLFPDKAVYHDVIVQVSDDPKFQDGVTTLYNNDYDNSAKLGIGEDYEYVESNQGRLVDAKGLKARYVRCYTNGSNLNEANQVIEIEVWGQPARQPSTGPNNGSGIP